MRIVLVAQRWYPVPAKGYGPCETVIDGLCRGLSKLGKDVVLFAASDSACPVPLAPGMPESRPDLAEITAVEATHVLEVYKQAKEFDIVHDHTLVGLVHSLAFPNLRVVATSHGGFNAILNPFFEALGSRVTIVANSRAHAADATVPTVPILHGIDVNGFTLGQGAGGYMVSIGRMNPNKGFHVSIEVARQARIPLKLAARRMREDLEKQYFDAVVKPLLGGDIEFLGEVGGSDKVELLSNAMALLNPVQWNEPFGLVNAEALACGTPVIGTPRGALPEIIDDEKTGFLCNDKEALVKACGRVGEIDRNFCRMTAERRFSFERMAADYVTLYEKLMAGVSPFE